MGRARLWAVCLAGAVAVTGCGDTTGGVPAPALPTTPAVDTPASTAAWDPCTIPDEAIDAAGLAVETKRANAIGTRPISPDWVTCFWMNPIPDSWYSVGIFSSTFTFEYLRERGPFEQFTPIEGFDGLRFQRKIQYEEVSCGIAFGRDDGVVYLILDGFPLTVPLSDACVEIERVARSLRSHLPSSN